LLEKLQQFAFKDDTFFTVACEQFPEVAEFILRILFDKPSLKVLRVTPQRNIGALLGRSLRLDVLATGDDGRIYNIEVQQASAGAIPKRARFHSSAIDNAFLPKGEDFARLPESWVVFITQHDVIGSGHMMYHIDRVVAETGLPFRDEAHIVYACMDNADFTPAGQLLDDLQRRAASDIHYPLLAQTMRYLKETTKGVSSMCEIMEEAIKYDRMETAAKMLKKGIITEEEAMDNFDLTEDEIRQIAAPNAVFFK